VLLGLALWFLDSADFCVGVRSEQGFGSTMIVECMETRNGVFVTSERVKVPRVEGPVC
jgi:hypothetical protein